jgi:hypothetical protein
MGNLRRVGSMWKPKPGSKVKATGSVTINGLRQRFMVMPNDKKTEGSREPDYALLSSDEPEVDEYAKREASAPAKREAPATQREPAYTPSPDDDIPF